MLESPGGFVRDRLRKGGCESQRYSSASILGRGQGTNLTFGGVSGDIVLLLWRQGLGAWLLGYVFWVPWTDAI